MKLSPLYHCATDADLLLGVDLVVNTHKFYNRCVIKQSAQSTLFCVFPLRLFILISVSNIFEAIDSQRCETALLLAIVYPNTKPDGSTFYPIFDFFFFLFFL